MDRLHFLVYFNSWNSTVWILLRQAQGTPSNANALQSLSSYMAWAPKGRSQGGPKGLLQLEVGAMRAPRLLFLIFVEKLDNI